MDYDFWLDLVDVLKKHGHKASAVKEVRRFGKRSLVITLED